VTAYPTYIVSHRSHIAYYYVISLEGPSGLVLREPETSEAKRVKAAELKRESDFENKSPDRHSSPPGTHRFFSPTLSMHLDISISLPLLLA
jgi:hypothetical protein